MGKLIDWIMDFLYDLAYWALAILPNSPFQTESFIATLNKFSEVMSNINYFVPFGQMLVITSAFLGAVLIWYGVRWILRLANYIS